MAGRESTRIPVRGSSGRRKRLNQLKRDVDLDDESVRAGLAAYGQRERCADLAAAHR
jgi:hypothetical protein